MYFNDITFNYKRPNFNKTPIKSIAFLGDSLTDDTWSGVAKGAFYPPPNPKNHWTRIISRELCIPSYNFGIAGDSALNIASTASRTDDVIAKKPSHCILMIGGNDIYGGQTPDQIINNIATIVTKLKNANITVILMWCPISPYSLAGSPDSETQWSRLKVMSYKYSEFANSNGLKFIDLTKSILGSNKIQISGGAQHIIGLKTDGTLIGSGYASGNELDIQSLYGINKISAGQGSTLAINGFGAVIALGGNVSNYSAGMTNWYNLIDVKPQGGFAAIGLKENGEVVATNGVGNVSSWSDIIAIAAGAYHSLGLKSDKTVVSIGDNSYKQRDIQNWSNIKQIYAKNNLTAGLKTDGTICVTGDLKQEYCDIVKTWKNVSKVALLQDGVAALHTDGTISIVNDANYDVSNVKNVIDIDCTNFALICLLEDYSTIQIGTIYNTITFVTNLKSGPSYAPRGKFYHPDVVHVNTKGQCIIANYILKELNVLRESDLYQY